jgi:pimeloyl-ACP methyl ester carboxylesterase
MKQLRQSLMDAGLRDPVDTKLTDPGPLLAESGYVQVGDLHMYYEIGGEGEPLVMLHGGMLQSGVFYAIAPVLAEKRQVILVDQQGHGRTADIDGPLSFEQMADDTAALLEKIGVKQADFFGYSEGGVVA